MSTTTLTGLTDAEVAERSARGQVNRVRRSDLAEYLDIVRRNVVTLFNALVVPAALALFLLDRLAAALAVSGMALTNLVLGLVQEIRAKWHLDHLALLSEARARVRRNGQVYDIPSGEVVQDDLLLLASGDSVLADGPLVEARFLEIDEALLTGESDPVVRRVGDTVLSGSFCVAGEGCFRAEKVGAAAFAQRTTIEARAYRYQASPMQQSIDQLIRILTGVAVLLCLSYLGLRYLRPIAWGDLVEMWAATITSMIPQGLVLMTTLAFILGAIRLSQRGALVQRLNAVEAMASIDTLCMDKTGTLTTNNLHLERLVPLTEAPGEEEIRRRLRLFASTSIDRGSKTLAALRAGLGEETAELLDQLPFKSQNRYSAVRLRHGGQEYALALGAVEALKPFLTPESVTKVEKAWQDLLSSGWRLLLLTEIPAVHRPFAGSGEGDPRAGAWGLCGLVLRPLALVALSDELRPEAGEVLDELAGQGISFKILSGDNAQTVRATVADLAHHSAAPAVRALVDKPVVEGAELAQAKQPQTLIDQASVFGRVSPWQKVEIVAALRRQGRRVAMIGDGVNDVLPIKNADLGVAMGEGSRAAKTVAGLVLETNDFRLLPQTLDEGRTIVRNLRRAGKLFLAKNVYMLILIVGALGVFGLPFPFHPQQVTLLNFLTIGLPALVITLSKDSAAKASRIGFVHEIGSFALRVGAVVGVAGLILFLLSGRVWEHAEKMQRTQLLTAIVLLGWVTLLRALDEGDFGRGDWVFLWLIAGCMLIFLSALYLPPAAEFFALEPLSLLAWGQVMAVAGPAATVLWLTGNSGRKLVN